MTTTPTSGAADLRTAAQAVVDRWDTPLWKDVPATAEYIGRLLAALAAGQATAAQQGAAYAALPEPYCNAHDDADACYPDMFSEHQMHAFADATHTLRASHGQAPDGATEPTEQQILEAAFAPAQPAVEPSRFGGPELQAMIIARCVEKDQADSVPAGGYPPLPNFDSSDEPIWGAIFNWKTATPGADAGRKANKVENAIIETMRAYVDADRAARAPADNKKEGPTMSFHNKPDYQIPELIEALKAHRLPHDTPSQLADSFRIGWMAFRELAQADSGFDYKTAADFLSGKTVSDEALRKFVAASRGAHDARAALHAKMLSLQGELASREAEIALLKRSLLDAEAAPQPAAKEPVCKGVNCSAVRGVGHSTECESEHDSAASTLNTAGNRNPEARYAGYKGQPALPAYTEDQLAAWQEGASARITTAAPQHSTTALLADSVPAVSDLPPLPAPDLRDVGRKPQEIKEFLKGYATEYARTAIAASAPADSVLEDAAQRKSHAD